MQGSGLTAAANVADDTALSPTPGMVLFGKLTVLGFAPAPTGSACAMAKPTMHHIEAMIYIWSCCAL